MKFSESWLRQWVSPHGGTDALADLLTMAGLAGVALVAGACVRAWRDLVRTLPAQPKASAW